MLGLREQAFYSSCQLCNVVLTYKFCVHKVCFYFPCRDTLPTDICIFEKSMPGIVNDNHFRKGIYLWNNLEINVQLSDNVTTLKSEVKMMYQHIDNLCINEIFLKRVELI